MMMKKSCIGIYFIGIIAYFVLMLSQIQKNDVFNGTGILIYLISFFLFVYGINSTLIFGLTIDSIFLVMYFGALALNCLNISGLQKEKTIIDFYYYFFGPIVFWLLVRYIGKQGNKKVIKIRKLAEINSNLFSLIILLLFILTKYRLFFQTGIRLITEDWLSSRSYKYVVPGLSGLSMMLMWLLLMSIPRITNKILLFFSICIPIISTLLSAKRGDIVRIALFLGIWLLYRKGERIQFKKILIPLILFTTLFMYGFSFMGNYRQARRDAGSVSTFVGTLLESNTNIDIINWIYGYIAINFDVLKQCYIERNVKWEMLNLFEPLMRIIGGNKAVLQYEGTLISHGLRGFNAGTFLEFLIYELGPLYIIDILILAAIIWLLYRACIKTNYEGGVVMLILMMALTPFGNYFTIPNYFLSLAIGILINAIFSIGPESVSLALNYFHNTA